MKKVLLLRGLKQKSKNRFWSRIFAFLFFVLILHPSSFILLANASYVSELRFQESLKAFKNGDYRNAMLGFMDVVVEEPENGLARNYLSEAGRRVLGMEDRNIQLRRKELLHDAEAMKKRLDSLEESKTARIREWDRLFSRAKDLAGNADSLREAVAAYEEFIRKTPLYAELRGEFSEKEKIIWGTFYETIKKRYPEMVSGRTSVDEADLGGVFFVREAINDSSYRYVNSRQTESILAKSSRIKYLRRGVSALLDDETRALDLYSRGKFVEADSLFAKVMKAGAANEEAAFYSELAAECAARETAGRGKSIGKASGVIAAPPQLPPAAGKPGKPAAAPAVKTAKTAAKLGGGSAKLLGKGMPRVSKPSVAYKKTAAPGAKRNSMPDTGNTRPALLARNVKAAGLPAVDERSNRGQKRVVNKPVSMVPQPGAGGAADKLYERGVREFSVGDYGGAAKSWDECLRLNPGHTKAKLGRERLKSSGGGARPSEDHSS